MILAAFDPGKTTSYALFDTTTPWTIEVGEIGLVGVGRDVRPCGAEIRRLVERADMTLVEKVGAMTKQGVSSMFTFGLSTGAILGALAAMDLPIERIEPTEWKKGSRLNGLDKNEAKIAARRYAKELWPEHAEIFDVSQNHGMAEAALMARWFFLMGPGRDIPVPADCQVKVAPPPPRKRGEKKAA